MLKIMLAATTALTLASGVCLADSTTTKSLDVGPLGMSTTVHHSDNESGTVIEKDKTVREGMADPDVVHKDKTVRKSTDVSPTGDVTHSKSETTTIR